MKRIITTAAAGLVASSVLAIGASQEWVKDYISRLNGGTNAVITVDAGAEFGEMRASFELASVMTLVATNSSSAAITNGTRFVNTDPGLYKTRTYGGYEITATRTNFVYNGVQSTVVDGLDSFGGLFSVYGEMVTPSRAKEMLK